MADDSIKNAAPETGAATTEAPAPRAEGGPAQREASSAPREGSSAPREASSGPREGSSGPREGGYQGGGGSGPRGPRPAGRPGSGPGGPREGGRKFFRRKKVCKFCVEKIDSINYKDVRLLSGFVSEAGKIVPRRLTGVCTPHQRRLADAIKQARNIALLPFAGR